MYYVSIFLPWVCISMLYIFNTPKQASRPELRQREENKPEHFIFTEAPLFTESWQEYTACFLLSDLNMKNYITFEFIFNLLKLIFLL